MSIRTISVLGLCGDNNEVVVRSREQAISVGGTPLPILQAMVDVILMASLLVVFVFSFISPGACSIDYLPYAISPRQLMNLEYLDWAR